MGRTDRRLPSLTEEELANPCTRISLDGVEVQLWQVAHIYGLNYEMPSPSLRGGASSEDFRLLWPRARDGGTEPPNRLTSGGSSNVNESTPFTDRSMPPVGVSPRREIQQRIRHPTESDSSSHGSGTRNILRLIDELVDECWRDGIDKGKSQDKTAVPVTALSDTAPRIEEATWADRSFPPPSHPPPRGPLPRVPERSAGKTDPGVRRARHLAVVPRPTAGALSRRSGMLIEYLGPKCDNHDSDDDDGNDDADSERTITPRTSRRQLAAGPRERNASMPNPRPSAERPAAVHQAGRAASASSILCNSNGANCHRLIQRPGPARAQSKQVRPPLPHPLPGFLLNPPSFLQHPPDLSQQPHPSGNRHNTGTVVRRDPRPSERGLNISSPAAAPSAPRSPTPNTSDDDVAVTSRWSSDSEDERESKMKKLKKVLSLSKLRPRKSSLFQKQAATEAGRAAGSVGRPTSDSSGTIN
ncbi:hypothetical protein VTH06DRAFT_5593 [Thermothelomyces fergusii]